MARKTETANTKTPKAVIQKAVEQPKRRVREGTFAYVCRMLILQGKTDDQIWKVLRRKFGAPEEKRSYIGWYRAEIRRKGITLESLLH